MNTEMIAVSCLSCGWISETEGDIENANYYAECLGECKGREALLLWNYADGSIAVTNTQTGDVMRVGA